MTPPTKPRIELGRIVATPAALKAIPKEDMEEALECHHSGDWGNVCDEDKQCNEMAVKEGARLLSSYRANAVTFWILTEADRSVTTILLPSDY